MQITISTINNIDNNNKTTTKNLEYISIYRGTPKKDSLRSSTKNKYKQHGTNKSIH